MLPATSMSCLAVRLVTALLLSTPAPPQVWAKALVWMFPSVPDVTITLPIALIRAPDLMLTVAVEVPLTWAEALSP